MSSPDAQRRYRSASGSAKAISYCKFATQPYFDLFPSQLYDIDTFWQFYLLNEKKSLLYVYLILEWGMYNDLTKQNVFGETCVFGNSWPAP